jgi:uncharacterized secreted protein with C-terminal beta-propeller domain
MKKLEQLLTIFEKHAGDVIPFKQKKTRYDNIDEFEQAVRGSDISDRQKEVIESIMQTTALESENQYLDIPEEAYMDLQNYLRNWITEWTS